MSPPMERATVRVAVQPVRSLAFWRSYLVTARPYLCFASGSAGLVGVALSPGLGWGARSAALGVFFLVYGLGQALTDVSQTDTDALSAPYRPLVRGAVTPRQIAWVSLVGLGVCGGVLTALNVRTLPLAAAAVAGLGTYTWAKRRWWAGPLYNAWIVALLPMMGFLSTGARYDAVVASPALLAATSSVLFSYVVFVVLGYLKDVSADRATGYITLPVRFGWRATVAASAVSAGVGLASSAWLVSLSCPAVSGLGARFVSSLGLWAVGALAMLVAHITLLRIDREADAHAGIGWSIRAFVLLHLAEAAMVLPSAAPWAWVLWASFELALQARPARSQI